MLKEIYTYPIKSAGGSLLHSAYLQPQSTLSFDRRFAISIVDDKTSSIPAQINKTDKSWRIFASAKTHGGWLLRIGIEVVDDQVRIYSRSDPNLASYCFTVDHEPLSVEQQTNIARYLQQIVGDYLEPGCQLYFADLHNYFPNSKPRLGLWDDPRCLISITNLASLRQLEEKFKQQFEPLRFRSNLTIDCEPAFCEQQTARLMIGEAELEIVEPIARCKSINYDPNTYERDGNWPSKLAQTYGEPYCGGYAQVIRSGKIQPGDKLRWS